MSSSGRQPAWVLAIAGDPRVRGEVRDVLERAGIAVMTVASAGDAIRLSVEERPALVVIDPDLPDMDGEELLCHLQVLLGAAPPPALVLAEDGDRAIAGAAAIVPKATEEGALLEAIGRHLGRVAA